MRCQICYAYIPEGSTHCLECGAAINAPYVCQKCGSDVRRNASFCPKCGAKIIPPPKPPGVETAGNDQKGPRKCKRCDSVLSSDAVYCAVCGTFNSRSVDETNSPEPDAPKVESELKEQSTDPVPDTEKCPACGTYPRGTGRFCYNCGKFLGTEIENIICPSCGSASSLRYSRCQLCGKDLPPPEKRKK